MLKRFTALTLLALALGTVPHPHHPRRAAAAFVAASVPYLPGSTIPIEINGINPPYRIAILGPGVLQQNLYHVPNDASGNSSVVASGAAGIAEHVFDFAAPPDPSKPFIAVATYDDGVIIHQADAPFTMNAALAIGGAPGDVAIEDDGLIGTGTTNGDGGTIARLKPWNVISYSGVPGVDEVAFDRSTHALFLTNRDVDGAGALTRITADGTTSRRVLGMTAEGLAVDSAHRRVYVANVNDGTISIVDADSMVELSRFKAIDRVFALALDPSGKRLYAISNQSLSSPFAAPGSAIAIDITAPHPRIVAKSPQLSFPVGVAFDARTNRVFVTDEKDDDVYVLDPHTLARMHDALPTCSTPWKPTIDGDRLYVPCARADRVDVFDTRTLRHLPGAPFATGGYPLAVAVWHGQ